MGEIAQGIIAEYRRIHSKWKDEEDPLDRYYYQGMLMGLANALQIALDKEVRVP